MATAASSACPLWAACCAMSLPISTPPNAIAYSTGLIQQTDMVKAGATIGTVSTGGALEPVLDTLAQVRQQLRAAAVNTNQQVNDYLQAAGTQVVSAVPSSAVMSVQRSI